MKERKTDHRSRYTQMTVKKGLLKLLKEKPLNNISVVEVCSAAGVNRGTFYNHFYDVYDVYEEIENDFFDEVKEKVQNFNMFEFEKNFFKEILVIIYRNIDMCVMIINSKNNSNFLNRIMNFIQEIFIEAWEGTNKNLPENALKYLFSYSVNGSIGVISDWVNSGMKESLDEMAGLIEKYNKHIMSLYR